MPAITFLEPGGMRRTVSAMPGESLMVAATRAGIDGIIGECGGSAMCATCHCYVLSGELAPPESLEAETIEFVAENTRPESRLTCQITVSDAMEGLVLQVAAR